MIIMVSRSKCSGLFVRKLKGNFVKKTSYSCTMCKSNLFSKSDGLHCTNGHFFPFVDNSNVPVFDSEDDNANEYTTEEAAEIHDNSLKWLFSTFGGTEAELRDTLISKLHLKKGQKILITGTGAGNDLPMLASLVGREGAIFAQDFSSQMLMSAVERSNGAYDLAGYNIDFSVSDATNLPFHDNFFDAVYHFGGLNIFPSIENGIGEMDRVVKEGGRVVFGDEGLPPWLKKSEYGKMIINNNSLCDFEAPLKYLPQTARDVRLSWEVGYCFYIIEYTASKQPLPINTDVLHLGTRGGSMKTRYFGKLEGVDPELKEQLYSKAKEHGLSRVEFIEELLRKGL